MQQAPVLMIVFGDRQAYLDRYAEPDKAGARWPADRPATDWPVPYWHVDAGMAAMILLLAAHDAGLGACFFGVPADRWDDLRAAFDVPAGLRPVGVISLGYPAPATATARRRGVRCKTLRRAGGLRLVRVGRPDADGRGPDRRGHHRRRCAPGRRWRRTRP